MKVFEIIKKTVSSNPGSHPRVIWTFTVGKVKRDAKQFNVVYEVPHLHCANLRTKSSYFERKLLPISGHKKIIYFSIEIIGNTYIILDSAGNFFRVNFDFPNNEFSHFSPP